jgi:hypothetical protein
VEPSPQQASLPREAWTRAKKFILPDDPVSLKTIFDNIRNYLMCAGVVGAIGVLGPSTAGGSSILIAFSIVLIAANALQSWLVIVGWTRRIERFQREVRPNWGRIKRRLWRVVLFVCLLPPVTAMFQAFGMLIRWALVGGKA